MKENIRQPADCTIGVSFAEYDRYLINRIGFLKAGRPSVLAENHPLFLDLEADFQALKNCSEANNWGGQITDTINKAYYAASHLAFITDTRYPVQEGVDFFEKLDELLHLLKLLAHLAQN